jgi:DNA polymerase-3 subunit alpha
MNVSKSKKARDISNHFVHLHVHSEYSICHGCIKLRDLVDAVSDMGMNALALTDYNVMYGTAEFYMNCTRAGVKPIIGCEIDIFDGGGTIPLVLLAENEEGYQNLVRLSSFVETDMPYNKKPITLRELEEYHAGLIALSSLSCVEISRLMISGDVEAAIHRANIFREIMGGNNFFLEIAAHEN